jgi:hypothetical protein
VPIGSSSDGVTGGGKIIHLVFPTGGSIRSSSRGAEKGPWTTPQFRPDRGAFTPCPERNWFNSFGFI